MNIKRLFARAFLFCIIHLLLSDPSYKDPKPRKRTAGRTSASEVSRRLMELVVRKNELLRELQLFQGIVERKNTIPILANILVDAKGDELRMLATDLEVALRSKCAATVAKPGCDDAAGQEAVRDREGAAGNRRAHRAGQVGRARGGRALRLEDADAAARGFSIPARGRHWHQDCPAARGHPADGGQDAVRDHWRGHALLPQRREVPAASGHTDAGGHRRAPAGAGRGEACAGRSRTRSA